MTIKERIGRLRAELTELGERPASQGKLSVADLATTFEDFHDFRERGAPGDKAPSFSDFRNGR